MGYENCEMSPTDTPPGPFAADGSLKFITIFKADRSGQAL